MASAIKSIAFPVIFPTGFSVNLVANGQDPNVASSYAKLATVMVGGTHPDITNIATEFLLRPLNGVLPPANMSTSVYLNLTMADGMSSVSIVEQPGQSKWI